MEQSVQHTLPDQYSAVISANFANRGYSLSFNEYWDGPTNRLRTEGRFTDTETAELIDFNTQILYRWKPNDITAGCVAAINASPQAGIIPPGLMALLRPSREFFSQVGGLNVSNLQYAGVTFDARTIEADLYTATAPMFGNNLTQTTLTVRYYFARGANIDGGTGIPIRVELLGDVQSRANESDPWTYSTIRHDYDWIMFVPKPVPAAVFDIPSICKNVRVAQTVADLGQDGFSAVFSIALPRVSSVEPVTVSPAPSPFTAQFRAVIEAKLTVHYGTRHVTSGASDVCCQPPTPDWFVDVM